MIRLQKYISECGYTSRRKAEELIISGKVQVNGIVVSELGTKIDEQKDKVKISGKLITKNNRKIYIMLNKPKGYITSVSDDRGRKTVMDLLKDVQERVFPVGRLDYDTEGLLILSNDGDFAFKLTHPKHQIEKTYIATMNKKPTDAELFRLERGVEIEDYIAKPTELKVISSEKDKTKIMISITQGKNRQVRKMFEEIGHPLTALKRISIGKLDLKKLGIGKWKYLTKNEIEYIFK